MRCMGVGYVRASKREQNPDLQRRGLEAAGCGRIFEERVSSRERRRPQLGEALDYCRKGDVLVVPYETETYPCREPEQGREVGPAYSVVGGGNRRRTHPYQDLIVFVRGFLPP